MSTVVTCPVCRKEWNAPAGSVEFMCNCHLYCESGSEPSDCSIVPVTFPSELGYPFGQHGTVDSGCDNILERQFYCSVHGKFSCKHPVLIEVPKVSGFVAKRYRGSEGEY